MAGPSEILPNTQFDISGLVANFLGSSGSGTTTSKGNISEAGINDMVKKILSSDSGLAAISQGERRAGIYNSTVNQQLVTNLVTQTAGELASRLAGQTTTTTKSEDPKIDPLKAGGAMALYSILSPSVGRLLGGTNVADGVAKMGTNLADLIFGKAGSTSDPNASFSSAADSQAAHAAYEEFQKAFSDLVGTGFGDIDWSSILNNPDMMDPSYGE